MAVAAGTLGPQVVAWAEAFLCHGPGDVQGQPLRLDDELCAFLARAYMVDARGRRLIRRACLSRPKGRAKSELAAVVACAELLGPVRCDGFDANGEPVGRSVVGPQVLTLATEEEQAGNTYTQAGYMLANGEAHDAYELDVGLTRTYARAVGGVLIPDTASASSADGARTTFCNFDETHLWTTPGLRELHAVVRRNLGKRAAAEPWSLETTIAFAPGAGSVAEGTHAYAHAITKGELDDPSLLYDHREAPAVDLHDDDALLAALVHVYGAAAEWLDLHRIVQEIRDPDTTEAAARRYWLNQIVAADAAWLTPDQWRRLAAPRDLEPGTMVTVGFDGGITEDSTALVVVTCTADDEPPYLFVAGLWEKPAGDDGRGWVIDRAEVDAAVDAVFERFDVLLMYADPPYWQSEIAHWQARHGPAVAREFPTRSDVRMGPATDELREAVREGRLEHSGDPAMERHVGNTRTRVTRNGTTIRKERPGSPLKIDAAVAAVLAWRARLDAIAAGLPTMPARRRKRGGKSAQLVTF